MTQSRVWTTGVAVCVFEESLELWFPRNIYVLFFVWVPGYVYAMVIIAGVGDLLPYEILSVTLDVGAPH